MVKYLKDEGYYHDLYDLWTIEEGLRVCEYWRKGLKDSEVKLGKGGLDLQLYFVKGERYRGKRPALEKWILSDKKRDEKLNTTEEPRGIVCIKCQGGMEVISKDLYDMDCDSLTVLCFFECPKCGKRKGVFDNGKEYVSKGVSLGKAEIDHWDQENAERKDREKKNQELLKKYRAEFCLSESDGEEYIISCDRLQGFLRSFKETAEKRADPDHQKAMKLKKLPIVDLEKFLTGVLGKEKYTRLVLDKPMIGKHVIVSVTVQDEESVRKEYDSVHVLQRVLKKALENTNWRLMSEGITYRLGYLSCRLKGYEQEADLVQIVKIKSS